MRSFLDFLFTLLLAVVTVTFLIMTTELMFPVNLDSKSLDTKREVTVRSKAHWQRGKNDVQDIEILDRRKQKLTNGNTASSTHNSVGKNGQSLQRWKNVIVSNNTPQNGTMLNSNLESKERACLSSISMKYSTVDETMSKDIEWCKDTMSKHSVVTGRSWGSLPGHLRIKWDTVNCNELLSFGKLQSCEQRWGWRSISDWLTTAEVYVKSETKSDSTSSSGSTNNSIGLSRVECAKSFKTSVFCQFMNVTLDFSKVFIYENTRQFNSGFFQLHTLSSSTSRQIPIEIPGLQVNKRGGLTEPIECSVVESKPTFLLSNDDIYNLGHFSNDLITIWSMTLMASRDSRSSVLLNVDGLRESGPAGGSHHRLMEKSDPDRHGPYVSYYESWFGKDSLRRASQYGSSKVCFKELYLMPEPGMAWFWNDWGRVNECSVLGPSPLYQSFNLFMRNRWRETFGYASLVDPDSFPNEAVHVVIEVRAINRKKQNTHSSARHIRNLKALLSSLQKIHNIKVTAQDFANIPFSEQLSLSHSAGVFVSMHGAGTTHIMHMGLGSDRCCALVELQPDHTQGFQTAQGYGNFARQFGLHYFRYESSEGTTGSEGTNVDVEQVTLLIRQAVDTVRTTPSCLHNTKDTRDTSVFPQPFFGRNS